eukprot:gene473-512_t
MADQSARPNRRKPCKFFVKSGTCKLGTRCRFAHDTLVEPDAPSNEHVCDSELLDGKEASSPQAEATVVLDLASANLLAAKLLKALRPSEQSPTPGHNGSKPPSNPLPTVPPPVAPPGLAKIPPSPFPSPPPGLATIQVRHEESSISRPMPAFDAAPSATAHGVSAKSEAEQQHTKEDMEMSGEEEELHSPHLTHPNAPKKTVLRLVHNQPGELRIFIKSYKSGEETEIAKGFYMRPGFRMTVLWKLSATIVKTMKENSLSIGLLRYGTFSNLPAIAVKPLCPPTSESEGFCMGTVSFFAPKAAGKFVYRLFDQRSKEKSAETLATSSMFAVTLIDMDIVGNLKHVLEAFDDNQPLKAITQLSPIFMGVKSCSNDNYECIGALNRSLEKLLDCINSSLLILDEGRMKKEGEKLCQTGEKTELGDDDEPGGDSSFWSSYRNAARVHAEAHEALTTLMTCKTPWYLVTEKLKNTIHFMSALYCPLQRRYFPKFQDLLEAQSQFLGFSPAAADLLGLASKDLDALNTSLQLALTKIVPPSDLYSVRECFRERLQKSLQEAGALPRGTGLVLYGSSTNNFGNISSDIDMCLLYPRDQELTPEDKIALIEQIGNALAKLGMSEVRTRPTARIPIVQFKDNCAGLDCDISVHNALALANTQLLRAYSNIDPRVRLLAYIIKQWAKSRHINSPSDGTLSSYGFLLTVIHFLQNRPIPLLPSLQQLPPNWMGQIDVSSSGLPVVAERNAAEGHLCNVYFLNPAGQQMDFLKQFASKNQETLAQLLVEYFRYYAWKFDFRHHVVSIRNPNQHVQKIDKCEQAAWPHSDILSIEDPFEIWYDVAHVIKVPQMAHIRKEFVRAHTLCCRLSTGATTASRPWVKLSDSLPISVPPPQFMAVLCEPSEAPVFHKPKST